MEKFFATESDIAHIESLYAGKTMYHGDTHGHSASCPNSDGKKSFQEWKAHMEKYGIDFATIVDHSQTYHMMRQDWDDTVFIGGSEPGLDVLDTEVGNWKNIDYGIIFTSLADMEAFLEEYPEDFKYDKENGLFARKHFKGNRERVAELIRCIKDHGGMFIYEHPFLVTKYGGYYDPVDPKNRFFADEIGFEVFNQIAETYDPAYNVAAYNAWVDFLNDGKRLYATSGSDCHSVLPWIRSLNTVYAREKNAKGFFREISSGNLTAGAVGIRMAVGDAVTGGVTNFAGSRVVIAVGDFHPLLVNPPFDPDEPEEPTHTFRVDIYDGNGLIFSQTLDTGKMNYFAFDADGTQRYYRATVYDMYLDKLIAVGNPVFNG